MNETLDVSDIPNLNIKITHKKWQIALSQSFALLATANKGDVICITGPSRAGKSKLISELSQLLCGENKFSETGLLPVIVVEAVNTGPNGTFSTKAFTQRMLEAVQHPVLSMLGTNMNDPLAHQKMDRSTEATLRIALERALIARKTRYLFIDEAQHAKYVSKSTQAAHAVLDSWKCLAQTAGLVLVIVGAYPILDILGNSPHLLGRKHQVHLPRYSVTEEDLREFSWIIAHYDQLLTLDKSIPTLGHCCELLYEGSLGCIGLLRAWLSRTAAFASVSNKPITKNLLKQTMLSATDRKEIAKEISTGEKLLSQSSLGGIYDHKTKSTTTIKAKNAKKNKPFQRKPARMKPGNRTEIADDDK